MSYLQNALFYVQLLLKNTAGNSLLWFGHSNGIISVWRAKDKSLVNRIKIHDSNQRIFSILPVNQEIWIAGDVTQITIIMQDTFKHLNLLPSTHTQPISYMITNGNSVFSASLDGSIAEWNCNTKTLVRLTNFDETIKCMTFCGELLCINQDKHCLLLTQKLEILLKWQAHKQQINAMISMCPEGNYPCELWTCSDDSTIATWIIKDKSVTATSSNRLITVEESARNTCGKEKITCLRLALNGKVIISGSYRELLIWDQMTRRPVQELPTAHTDQINCIEAAGETKFWTGSRALDGSLGVWSINKSLIHDYVKIVKRKNQRVVANDNLNVNIIKVK